MTATTNGPKRTVIAFPETPHLSFNSESESSIFTPGSGSSSSVEIIGSMEKSRDSVTTEEDSVFPDAEIRHRVKADVHAQNVPSMETKEEGPPDSEDPPSESYSTAEEGKRLPASQTSATKTASREPYFCPEAKLMVFPASPKEATNYLKTQNNSKKPFYCPELKLWYHLGLLGGSAEDLKKGKPCGKMR